MIFMPPRHGKSELASRRFPAWYIGKNPDKQIITASYSGDLATEFGREVRNIVASPEYSMVFNTRLSDDSRAANRWNTSSGGSYIAAGVGGGITGRGAHVALIDDPVKDREEADSETTREKVWSWYTSTLRTRLMPGGAIVVIQTRWHDDDLAGRLLVGSEEWDVLELKATPDDFKTALWPEWYPVEELMQIKSAIGPRDWNALFQQSPIPDEGIFFRKEDIQWYDDVPKHLNMYGASDYAVTEDGGDWTEHGVAGLDPNDDLYIVDWWRDRTTPDEWIESQCDLIGKYKPLIWCGESGPIRRAVEPFLTKRMNERKTYCRLEWLPTIHDKPTRARAIQARFSMKKVFLPRKPWAEELVKQMLRFPAGMVDDGVDVLGLFGGMLGQTWAARPPKAQPEHGDILERPTLDQLLSNHGKRVKQRRYSRI